MMKKCTMVFSVPYTSDFSISASLELTKPKVHKHYQIQIPKFRGLLSEDESHFLRKVMPGILRSFLLIKCSMDDYNTNKKHYQIKIN